MGIADKAKDAVGGEKGSDAALDKGANLADDKTGGKHADKIDKGQDALDGKIGSE
ncbi:antitoxin [Georgenia faecalis]|uniref:Antitoxin n=1 Tax=Georgenia faecalis TaxID=2483799 RepID=A0ABV9D730_9MICO|nr:antitoxin [Georgenia faecalis]